MTRAQKKLIAEILASYGLPERNIRGCIADMAKAIENPRKYRRELNAEVARLIGLCGESMDGDEIVGHRD
jgi:hypothetical protein